MFDKLADIERRYTEIEQRLSDPSVASDPNVLRELGKQHSDLAPIVSLYREYRRAAADIEAAREMAKGARGDDAAFLREEIVGLEERLSKVEFQLKEALIPKDPLDEKNVIVEIRSAAGGDEAALFAGELFEMYQRYAETHRFKTEILSGSPSDIGGFKEIVFAVKGKGAYSRLKHESGV